MDRTTLTRILEHAEGISGSGHKFEVAEKHRVTFYIGEPGEAMTVADVAVCSLTEDSFLVLTTRDSSTTYYVEYSSVVAIANRPPTEEFGRRAGFA